jgi:hypothetical protein
VGWRAEIQPGIRDGYTHPSRVLSLAGTWGVRQDTSVCRRYDIQGASRGYVPAFRAHVLARAMKNSTGIRGWLLFLVSDGKDKKAVEYGAENDATGRYALRLTCRRWKRRG